MPTTLEQTRIQLSNKFNLTGNSFATKIICTICIDLSFIDKFMQMENIKIEVRYLRVLSGGGSRRSFGKELSPKYLTGMLNAGNTSNRCITVIESEANSMEC